MHMPSTDQPNGPSQDVVNALNALYSQRSYEEAILQTDDLIIQFPQSFLLYNIRGAANAALNRLELAIENYSKALEILPDSPEIHNNIGIALKKTGDLPEAIDHFQKAIKIKPDYAVAHNNLGIALQNRGDLESAITSYNRAIELNPNFSSAFNNLGAALQHHDRNAAIQCFNRALQLNPNNYDALNNLGSLMKDTGNIDAAVQILNHAIQIQPAFPNAYHNLGLALQDQGDIISAINCFRRACDIDSGLDNSRSQMLHQLSQICDWDAIAEQARFIPELGLQPSDVTPFSMLTTEDHPARHRIRSECYVKYKFPQSPLPDFSPPLSKPKRLRIGYFSADFHNHATMYLMAKLFALHDRESFEIFAYSFGPDRQDEMRHRIVDTVDTFRDVRQLNDIDIAKLAREDQLDIAVDLKGHTRDARTGIFAYRAAPIQISFLGYPGTMGAPFIDYLIADQIIIPEDKQKHYSEAIIYFPQSYQINDNTREISNRVMNRQEFGLPENGFVFCSFNNNYKITPTEFDIWMRLLHKVPGSVLWLLQSNQWAMDNLRREADKRGIDTNRIVFAQRLPLEEHLSRHRLADLFLDTFIVNAHTTASDALWAGLPLITTPGDGFVARVAASLLNAVGLPELITGSQEEYEQLALDLATNPQKLTSIKTKLETNLPTSSLFDTELFAIHMADAYQQAYQRYFDGKSPATISIQ